jgi:hypothetical protein
MWKQHGKFVNNLPKRRCKTINQFNQGWLPVNAFHSINASGTGRLCPFCVSCEEDQHHILTCTHQHLSDQWKESSTIIKSKLISYDNNTPRKLIQLIGIAVTDWRTTSTPKIPNFLDQQFHQPFQAQSLIGRDQILKGRFSKKMATPHPARMRTGQSVDHLYHQDNLAPTVFSVEIPMPETPRSHERRQNKTGPSVPYPKST